MNWPGKILRLGATGPAVNEIQRKLGVTKTSVFDEATDDAVRGFQSNHVDKFGNPLSVDGEVGPLTWEALFGAIPPITQPPTNLAKEVIAIAAGQVGVREIPPGSNRGPQVERYLASVGCNPGDPWCMAFVYWCFKQQAKVAPCAAHRSGSCSEVFRWANQANKVNAAPLPGDIFLVKGGPTGHKHTGIVKSVDGGVFQTIEGNANSFGSNEGICVAEIRRKVATCDFVRVA